MEYIWTALMPFWLSTDDIYYSFGRVYIFIAKFWYMTHSGLYSNNLSATSWVQAEAKYEVPF